MYRSRGSYRGRRGYYEGGYKRPRYSCEDCNIVCTSFAQLQQHLLGVRHIEGSHRPSEEGAENSFHLEHMVVLDQTGDDVPNDYAASPATCDSSDSESATSASGHFSRSRMVILDETDDNDHPASPALCDSSDSESAPSCPGSEAAPGTAETSTSRKRSAKSDKTRRRESKQTFHIEPIESNQDVFRFLRTFGIANHYDVAFSEKVKEMFCRALRKYEERKLEAIFCTEAAHSSDEEFAESSDGPANHEETGSSLPQAPHKNECEKINSAPSSPANSSPAQCIIDPTSAADGQQDAMIISQPCDPDASSSPKNTCEDISISVTLPDSGNDNPCSAAEADLLMESENCITAEPAYSDDDDDDL
ncbi:uncharacterized protein [Eleutherodactylus coqui]|uniref:uncharacterized protein isoform X2 n=1 Tax=Eleutherodactylus coqui TaxID=57060 RepID=UPI00346184F1